MAVAKETRSSICVRFEETVQQHCDAVALSTLDGQQRCWSDYAEQVRATAAGLAGLGLRRGDVMACWLRNRPEFHIADTAALHLGAASFSIDNSFTVKQARHVVADAAARILVTEPAYVERAIALRAGGGTSLDHIVCVEGDAPEALGWDELLDAARPCFDFEASRQAVGPQDLATLIYTSGTTGPPKGVELTHANIVAQALALRERLSIPDGIRALSFLPMAHIVERLCSHYLPMFGGWQVTCCPDPLATPSGIAAVRPGYFFSPPRIWEKLRAAVRASADGLERAALGQALARVSGGGGVQHGPFQAGIRERVGFDQLQVAVVGAAPCPRELIAFWHACGVPLSEFYGTSETTGVATVAGPEQARIGTAGPPLPVCEVRLADGGEVCMRGPALTRGYRNLPGETAAAFDADGWLHSGDVGALDPDGHLRIVDRIEEIIVNAAGEPMSPANIEAALKADATLIGQACVIGHERPFNVALLTLDPDGARVFAHRAQIRSRTLSRHRRVVAAVAAEVAQANAKLARVERIKRFVLLCDEWLPGGDELTPMLKVKRRSIAAKYARPIAALYDEHHTALRFDASGTVLATDQLESDQSGDRRTESADGRKTP